MHDAQPLDLRVSEPHNEIYEEHVDPTRVPSKNLFSGNSNLVWKQGRVHKKESYIYITSEIRSLSARRCNNSYQMRDSRHFVLTYLSGYHSQVGKRCLSGFSFPSRQVLLCSPHMRPFSCGGAPDPRVYTACQD